MQFPNKKLRFKSTISVPYILDPNKVINIDEPKDLLLAKSILNEK